MKKKKKPFDRRINRLDRAEERIRELEDRSVGTSQTEKQCKKEWKQQQPQNIQELWNDFKRYNICIIAIPEGEVRENRGEGFKLWSGRDNMSSLCLRKYVKIHFGTWKKPWSLNVREIRLNRSVLGSRDLIRYLHFFQPITKSEFPCRWVAIGTTYTESQRFSLIMIL